MKYLDEIKDKLCEELEEYSKKGKMSAGDLETIHKLTDTIKNIGKICMLEEEGGYSEHGGEWEARGGYGMGRSYNEGGSSYARNRRRDSMGRYSRNGDGYSEEGSRGGNRGGYSRDGAKGYMLEQLEDMMENVHTEKEREAIRHCMTTLRNA